MTVSRPEKAEAFPVRGSGPQGLRRPRFSFFRFTCQTSRSLRAPPLPLRDAPAWGAACKGRAAETRTSVMAILDHGRMLGHRVNSEGLRGRAIAPRRAARREGVYSLAWTALSTAAPPKSPLWIVGRTLAWKRARRNRRILAGNCGAANSRQATTPFRPPAPGPGRTAATFLKRSLHLEVSSTSPSHVAKWGKATCPKSKISASAASASNERFR